MEIMSNELVVIGYVFSLVSFGYLWLYPKLKAYDLTSLSLYDLGLSIIVLIIGWVIYGGEEISFNLYFWNTSWFWFSIAIYFIIELPFVWWYFKKHHII